MINPVQANVFNTNFRNSNQQQSEVKNKFAAINEHPEKINKLNYSPVTVGILNGLCWGTVGMGIDMLISKLFKSKSNSKTSLIINGVFGAAMGVYAYHVAKREAKAEAQAEVK